MRDPHTPAQSDVRCAVHSDTRSVALVQFYQSLAPQDLIAGGRLGRIYAPDARFKDPFNEVQGLAAIAAVFTHMFKAVDQPRFVVLRTVAAGDEAFLTWDFRFQTRGRGAQALCIHGASHVQFNGAGQVQSHRDYWDVAEELYEKLPVLGALMRWLKRRAARA